MIRVSKPKRLGAKMNFVSIKENLTNIPFTIVRCIVAKGKKEKGENESEVVDTIVMLNGGGYAVSRMLSALECDCKFAIEGDEVLLPEMLFLTSDKDGREIWSN